MKLLDLQEKTRMAGTQEFRIENKQWIARLWDLTKDLRSLPCKGSCKPADVEASHSARWGSVSAASITYFSPPISGICVQFRSLQLWWLVGHSCARPKFCPERFMNILNLFSAYRNVNALDNDKTTSVRISWRTQDVFIIIISPYRINFFTPPPPELFQRAQLPRVWVQKYASA